MCCLFPDPRKSVLVELILQVGVGRLTEQQQDTLVRRLAALLNVLDSDVKVQKIQAHSDLRCAPYACLAGSCLFPLLVVLHTLVSHPYILLLKGQQEG